MMLAVATNRTPVARHGMANNPLTPEQKRRAMGAAIKALRERAVRNGRKVSQDAAAEVMSITRQAWQLYEAGERQIVLQSDVQERIATALGFEHEDLLEEYRRITGEQPRRHKAAGVVLDARMLMQAGGAELPIRDTVQAGAWLPADDSGQVATTYPASRVTVGACIEPLANPLAEGTMTACVNMTRVRDVLTQIQNQLIQLNQATPRDDDRRSRRWGAEGRGPVRCGPRPRHLLQRGDPRSLRVGTWRTTRGRGGKLRGGGSVRMAMEFSQEIQSTGRRRRLESSMQYFFPGVASCSASRVRGRGRRA